MASGSATRASGTDDGFTLIELLVVVAIIGILATIAMSALVGQRDRSRDAAVVSDLRHGYITATGHAVATGELPADWAELLAAGHTPSMSLDPANGAHVVYAPTDECLSLAHASTPAQSHRIDLATGDIERDATCAGPAVGEE